MAGAVEACFPLWMARTEIPRSQGPHLAPLTTPPGLKPTQVLRDGGKHWCCDPDVKGALQGLRVEVEGEGGGRSFALGSRTPMLSQTASSFRRRRAAESRRQNIPNEACLGNRRSLPCWPPGLNHDHMNYVLTIMSFDL